MKREALVPIDDELFRLISEQKQRVLQRFPAGAPVLFPRQNGNLNGRRPMSGSTYRDVATAGWRTATSATSTGSRST